MNPYLALTRPGNMILTAIAVIAGSFIAAGPEIMDFQIEVAICCVCSMMLVGGGNALNDYNDRPPFNIRLASTSLSDETSPRPICLDKGVNCLSGT